MSLEFEIKIKPNSQIGRRTLRVVQNTDLGPYSERSDRQTQIRINKNLSVRTTDYLKDEKSVCPNTFFIFSHDFYIFNAKSPCK